MRKLFCVLLSVCMLAATFLTVLPTFAAQESDMENVALGCSYTGTAPFQVEADKNTPGKYSYKTFTELTDGIDGTTTGGSEWYVFWKVATITETIDLGSVKNKLAKVSATFGYLNWGDKLPVKVVASVSENGTDFTECAELKCTATNTTATGVYEFSADLPANTSARYVRFDITSNNGAFVFLSELRVFAGYVNSFSIEDSRAFLDGALVRGISAKTPVAKLASMVNSTMGVTLLDHSGNVKTSGYFATGDRIVKTDENGKESAYTVIIDGDYNRDGVVDGWDYMALKSYVLQIGDFAMDEDQFAACDCQTDGKVDGWDYFAIKQHVLDIKSLYEKYNPYKSIIMSYEIPSNFNDKYENTFGVETYEQMTVCKKDDATIEMTYDFGDGSSWMASMVQKRWGMWMLGSMVYTRSDGKVENIILPSTDYEWVLGCGLSRGSCNWRGGNHGDYTLSNWNASDSAMTNDKFLDMTFYDAETGDKLELTKGTKVQAKGVLVVLHDNIYESTYQQENVILNSEKIYLFNGPSVQLDSRLTFGQDTYFSGNSYSCMMPIYKKYGNYARFYCDDGSVCLYKTPTVSSAGGNLGYKQASKVELWGEQNPDLHMTIEVHNPETQFLYSGNKTFLWNINATQNKLYFSMMGGASGENAMVKAKTVWNFKDSWTFSYQPDFKNPSDSEITQQIKN